MVATFKTLLFRVWNFLIVILFTCLHVNFSMCVLLLAMVQLRTFGVCEQNPIPSSLDHVIAYVANIHTEATCNRKRGYRWQEVHPISEIQRTRSLRVKHPLPRLFYCTTLLF